MISLRPCENTERDAWQAFEWRNDPDTVASAYYPEPKTWDSFYMEYAECYFDDPSFPPQFVIYKRQYAGFVRYDAAQMPEYPDQKIVEMMINIAPEFRGRGVGTRALALIKQEAAQKNVFGLMADIRKENAASIRLFEKAGFVFSGERTEYLQRLQKNCHILRCFYAL